jgi:hypothetical protein
MNPCTRYSSHVTMRAKLVTAIGLASCIYGPNPKCPYATWSSGFTNGTAQWTWSYDNTTGSIALDQVLAASHPCNGTTKGSTNWFKGDVQPGPLKSLMSLSCSPSPDHYFEVDIDLGDVASVAAGTFTATVHYLYQIRGPTNQSACLASGTANVSVRDATGGAAPVPALVTPDFARTFDIHIDGTMPVMGEANGTPCSPFSVDLTTSVTMKASDFHSYPDAICPN